MKVIIDIGKLRQIVYDVLYHSAEGFIDIDSDDPDEVAIEIATSSIMTEVFDNGELTK